METQKERFALTLLEIAMLPERCGCGSKKALVTAIWIETPAGELLEEVRCGECGRQSLIPDKTGEELRRDLGDKFRPIWYYNPEAEKIVHWSFCRG